MGSKGSQEKWHKPLFANSDPARMRCLQIEVSTTSPNSVFFFMSSTLYCLFPVWELSYFSLVLNVNVC